MLQGGMITYYVVHQASGISHNGPSRYILLFSPELFTWCSMGRIEVGAFWNHCLEGVDSLGVV